ncbi:MAG: hypothetical protein R2874_11695 [Desulfobacterales bacterium]
MTWFAFAILTAFSVALHDTWVKKWFSSLSAYEMFAIPLLYSLPLAAVTLLFVEVPSLDPVFSGHFASVCRLMRCLFFVYQSHPGIAAVAYRSVSGVHAGIYDRHRLAGAGELPDVWGIGGIAVVCLGSYVLNIDPENLAAGAISGGVD